ncbi:MAG: hypothetical protein WCO03_01600 [bacterium]
MDLISSFFERYKNLALPDESVRKELQKVVKEMLDIDLELKDISVKYFDVVVKAGGMTKAAIMINREKILDKMRAKCGDKTPRNIK